jgi:glutaredoxin
MAEVIIYSTTVCPYCVRAKQLLERKGVDYKEINLSNEAPEVRMELMQRTNHRRRSPPGDRTSSAPRVGLLGNAVPRGW